MILLYDPNAPMPAPVGLGLIALGIFGFVSYWRRQHRHPPLWVAYYRGGPSVVLSMPLAGVGIVALGLVGFASKLPSWFMTLDSLVAVVTIPLALFSFFFWAPPFLRPGWYRRARQAGVDYLNPDSVEAFRQRPKAEQRRAAAEGKQIARQRRG